MYYGGLNFAKLRGNKTPHLYEIATQIPSFMHITTVSRDDMNALDLIPYEIEAYYIFDRDYVDFARLHKVTNHSAYFVI